MDQYFKSSQEEEEDPVMFELDVYLNNPTLSDLIDYPGELPENISLLKELSSKPFERIMILQYPLELYNYLEDPPEEGAPRRLINANTSDKLELKSVQIGENVKNEDGNQPVVYEPQQYPVDRNTESPLVRLNFDLGAPYFSKYRSSPIKKAHKMFIQHKQELDAKTSPLFDQFDYTQDSGRILTLDSTVGTSEHVSDCLGILKIEKTEEGLKRELHLLPVKSVLQLRPKLDPFEEMYAEENSTELFFSKNLEWKSPEAVYFPDSEESKELIEHFIRYGKETKGRKNQEISFRKDREMYINSLYTPEKKTQLTFQSYTINTEEDSEEREVEYVKMKDLTPNIRFMKKLKVEKQLQMLLEERKVDSLNSLRRDIFCRDLKESRLVEMLSEFGKNIDGNWVLASEHAIEGYKEGEDFESEEREYLMGCRNLMLGLLNRQSCHPSMPKSVTSTGYLSSEPFTSATGLPLKIMKEMLTKIAKPQGKFWNLALPRDNDFCTRYPQVVASFYKFWTEVLPKSANIVQSFKSSSRVHKIVSNISVKMWIIRFLEDKVRTNTSIVEHLESLGYSSEHHNFEAILRQVGKSVGKKFWISKNTEAFINFIRSVTDGDTSDAKMEQKMPKFLIRRVKRFLCYF